MARRQAKPVGPHTMVALILQMQGKNAEAQKRYEKVLEIDRTAPVAANNLAWMYAEGAGNIDVALQLAQVAKAGLPDCARGERHARLDLHQEGHGGPGHRAAASRPSDKDPKNPVYRYHLGVAYAEAKPTRMTAEAQDKANAKTHLETALKLSPNFEGAADARKVLEGLK